MVAEWVATHGSDDQRERHAAGLPPIDEVIDVLADEAVAPVSDVPRYLFDGAERLPAHLRTLTGRASSVVTPSEFEIVGTDAPNATAAEWRWRDPRSRG